MNPLDAFLYGMPVVLMVGAAVILVFARRAAADIRSRDALKNPPKRRSFRSGSLRIRTAVRPSAEQAVPEPPRAQVH